ncbi:MAG: hypothetical protein ACP5I8_16915, partial [Phycisphaerae bacterium]
MFKTPFGTQHFNTLAARAAITGAALAAFAGLAVGTVSASTIYSDTFPGNGSATLNGTSPATDATGATWTVSNASDGTGWQNNGASNLDSYAGPTATLPFTPVTGQIYTLS